MWRLKRIQFTLLAVVVVVVGATLFHFFSGPSDKDCAPVRELLSYNKTQIDAMNAKTHVPEKGSYDQATEPSDMDYRNWADGLGDRAAKVSSPELGQQAKELAATANRLASARIDFNAQSKNTAPGAPPPPAAMVVSAFYDEFQQRVSQLAKACS